MELNGSILAVNLTIINDVFVESNESFVIYLTSGAGVKLFPHAQTEVIIIDDEGKFECICILAHNCLSINLVVSKPKKHSCAFFHGQPFMYWWVYTVQ